MKTCYYELLGVESIASDKELKVAYRRKALQYHPDKNRDDVESATQKFSEIRLAYEVLSDPHERAWYDAHKSQVLRDDTDSYADQDYDAEPEVTGTTTEEILRFFDPSLYTRIDDTIAGLYHISSSVFDKLAAEEVIAGRQQGLDGYAQYQDDDPTNTTDLLYPKFGNSRSDYASQVRVFYQAWSTFSSVKSFCWMDEYRYSTAADRRARRAMEKENKKARDSARREYNETIRSYVAFVKKRDPRVKAGAAIYEKERRRKNQRDLQKQVEKDRAMNAERRGKFQEQTWQQINDIELEEIENHFISSSEDSEDENSDEVNAFECVICSKIFKTEKQFKSHEASKKHKKLLSRLKWEMKKEGIVLGIDPVSDEDEFNTADEDIAFEEEEKEGEYDSDSDLENSIEEELRKVEEELARLETKGESTEVEHSLQNDVTNESFEDYAVEEKEPHFEVDDLVETDDSFDMNSGPSKPKNLSKKQKKKQKYAPKATVKKQNNEKDELEQLAAALEKGKLIADPDDDWSGSVKAKTKKKKRK